MCFFENVYASGDTIFHIFCEAPFYLLFVVFVLLYHLCSWFIDVQMANEKWQGILVDCLTVWWDLLLSCWDERSHGSCVSCICPVGWDRMISCSRNENAMKWKCWGAEYYAIGMYSNTHSLWYARIQHSIAVVPVEYQQWLWLITFQVCILVNSPIWF